MLEALGFRETSSETVGDAYTVTGLALTDTTTAWGTTDLKINDVAIITRQSPPILFKAALMQSTTSHRQLALWLLLITNC
jgi:hypothetical protein